MAFERSVTAVLTSWAGKGPGGDETKSLVPPGLSAGSDLRPLDLNLA